jgi:hypothetical protein
MTVNFVPVLDFEQIYKDFDIDVRKCPFYCNSDNAGYFWLGTDEYDLEEKEVELEMEQKLNPQWCGLKGLKTEVKLVKRLREMGLTDGVIIAIYN